MEHSTEAEFQLGEAVADRETAEQGEVIAVNYDEVLEEYIYYISTGPKLIVSLCTAQSCRESP
jgi:hypothetical protein